MPTRNVSLTEELDSFVASKVESGRYENASEVFRAGLRALEQLDRIEDAKVANLRAALEEGERSGIAKGNPFTRVRRSLRRSKQR